MVIRPRMRQPRVPVVAAMPATSAGCLLAEGIVAPPKNPRPDLPSCLTARRRARQRRGGILSRAQHSRRHENRLVPSHHLRVAVICRFDVWAAEGQQQVGGPRRLCICSPSRARPAGIWTNVARIHATAADSCGLHDRTMWSPVRPAEPALTGISVGGFRDRTPPGDRGVVTREGGRV